MVRITVHYCIDYFDGVTNARLPRPLESLEYCTVVHIAIQLIIVVETSTRRLATDEPP